MGSPVWLQEKGSQVQRFYGMPGQIVEWVRVGQNGGEPKKIDGSNPPNATFTMRQQYLGDFEEATGTYDVVKGTKPSGVAAYSALQLLVEQSQSRFNTSFKARGEAYRQWAQVAFELERKYGPTERIHNVMGPNRGWIAKVFQNADLQAGVMLIVEDGTNKPRTSLAKRAALEHGNQMGLMNFDNPDEKHAALTMIGITELNPTLDADVMSACQEQQMVVEWAARGEYQTPMPFVRMPWHDDATHFAEHRKWMNSDEAREILVQAGPYAGLIIEAWGKHLADHQMNLMRQQMLNAMGQAGPGGPMLGGGDPTGGQGKDGGGVGAGRAAHDSNRQGADGPPVAKS